MELYELRQRQSLPLEAKITMSLQRIREWHEHWDGQVYVSFSGGKDSSVLLHLVRLLYQEVPAAFVDTGLEFPAIRSFVRSVENVIWLRRRSAFRKSCRNTAIPRSARISREAYITRGRAATGHCTGFRDRIRTARRPNGTLPGRKSGKSCWTHRSKSVICAAIG